MSIQINGIEKPKNCFDCPCIDAEFEECAAREHYLLPKDEYGAVLGDVPDWCPITELQTCDDAVSRQAAIDHWRLIIDATSMDSRYDMGFIDGLEFCINHLSTMPSVQPEIIMCKDCKHWRDSDGVYRRGVNAESKCPLNTKEVYAGTFYCGYAERRTDEQNS